MNIQTTEKLDAILRKVQGLLANADDSANTPEAQEAYRQMAEALMFKYRVDETMAAARHETNGNGLTPVWRKLWVSRSTGEFVGTYRYMASVALGHVDAKSVTRYERNPEDGNHSWLVVESVGYESDLRYAEVLYTAMHLAFAGKMEPKVNPEKSDAENAYILRSAGMEGWRIAKALWNDEGKPARVRARKLFAKHAESIGEDPSVLLGRGNAVKVYRESYAEGFETEMWDRLNRMRMSHGDKDLILASRKEAVTEAYYEKYPQFRPGATTRSTAIGGRDTCDKCQKAKSGYCREHGHLRPRAVRYVERSFNGAGYARGQVAARSVDLGSAGTGRVTGSQQRSIS